MAVASEEEAGSDSPEDAAMTPSTSPGETSAVTSAANTDLCSALRRRYEGMTADERQAMALDDVLAELRRRLSGSVPCAAHARPRAAEEARPLFALTGDEEEGVPIEEDHADIEQESNSFCFIVYFAMSDGFLAAVALSGRSAEVGSLNKLSIQDRIAFAAADEK